MPIHPSIHPSIPASELELHVLRVEPRSVQQPLHGLHHGWGAAAEDKGAWPRGRQVLSEHRLTVEQDRMHEQQQGRGMGEGLVWNVGQAAKIAPSAFHPIHPAARMPTCT